MSKNTISELYDAYGKIPDPKDYGTYNEWLNAYLNGELPKKQQMDEGGSYADGHGEEDSTCKTGRRNNPVTV